MIAYRDILKIRKKYEIVKRCMIHGTCGNGFNDKAASMENKKCTKEYPKAFCNKTVFNVNGFPFYCENKRIITLPNGKEVDNRWLGWFHIIQLFL
jgi:hypothetical protein